MAARAHGDRYAVIGLGTGTLACRAEPDDTVHYYEIDPAMIRWRPIPKNFNFLSECRPVTITLGDARLTLAEARTRATTSSSSMPHSDAIPIHLLTREAMAIYARSWCGRHRGDPRLQPHLELASVVAGIAKANDMVSARQRKRRRDRERC